MARKLDDEVQTIAALRADAHTERARDALRKALASKHSVVVATAAQVIAGGEVTGLEDAMVAAFDRFMHEPSKRDKGCLAKQALAHALYTLESDCVALFLRGIRHVQLEPGWGGAQDSAAALRGTCALGLVRTHHADAMLELSRLLADPEANARTIAAQAIAYSTDEAAGAPLLRYKILAGDDELAVTAACLQALLALSSDRALPFVAELTQRGSPELREAAVLALGEARLPGALAPLRALAEEPAPSDLRRVASVAIAMLRSDAAWDYLVAAVEDAPEGRAREAIDALSTYRHDAALRARVEAAAEARGDPRLAAAVAAAFG